MDFSAASVIVTGAGSGIGRSCALAFARSGARVVVADIDEGRAAAVAAEICATDADAIAMGVDVTDPECPSRLRDAALTSFGAVDVIMNNVGVVSIGPPHEIPVSEWQRVIDINLTSIVRSNEVFVPHLLEQGHGQLVITASSEGLFRAQWNQAPYSATKAAVIALCDALWMYLSPKGIGVTCVAPGPVITNIAEQMRTFGEAGPMVGPQLPLIDPAVIGDQVVTAVERGDYLVYTHDGMAEMAVRAAADRAQYLASELQRVADVVAGVTPPPWELVTEQTP